MSVIRDIVAKINTTRSVYEPLSNLTKAARERVSTALGDWSGSWRTQYPWELPSSL